MCPANGFLFFPMIDTPIELAISEIPIAIIDMSVYTFNFTAIPQDGLTEAEKMGWC